MIYVLFVCMYYMGMKSFDIVYFGLLSLAISFVLYMGIDFANAQVESYKYIVYKYGNTTNALNSFTGNVDYSGTDAGLVISQAEATFYPNAGAVIVKCGNYNLYSQIQLWKSASLYGEGIDCTVFKREFNATIPQMIRATPSYQGYNGYTNLKDFTIDGNFGHSNATLEMSIAGNGSVFNIKAINYNGIALELDNNAELNHYIAIGVNSPTKGSVEGLWTAPNSKILMTNSDIENNRLAAIFAQGNDTIISGSYFSHNHCQTSPTGGGQVALVYGGMIANNIIKNGCGSVTSGIETNYGTYIITGNIITGNQNNGISTNGQISTIISSNNYLKGNGHAISSLGSAMLYESNDVK